MKKVNELLNAEEIKEIKSLIKNLNTWIKPYRANEIEYKWINKLTCELNKLIEFYTKKSTIDGEYMIYCTRQHFTNVEEMYRTVPKCEKRYLKLYHVWEILFEAEKAA